MAPGFPYPLMSQLEAYLGHRGQTMGGTTKFFTPDSGWTWYASEGSPVDADGYMDTDKEKVDFFFFGLVVRMETEIGYFALSELEEARGPLGLPIERDEGFTPTTLVKLKELHQ